MRGAKIALIVESAGAVTTVINMDTSSEEVAHVQYSSNEQII